MTSIETLKKLVKVENENPDVVLYIYVKYNLFLTRKYRDYF